MNYYAVLFFYVFICAVSNCARGRLLFDLTTSTEVTRLVSMGIIALATSLFALPNLVLAIGIFGWVFAGLMLWSSPLWDKYWGEEIGDSATHSKLYGLMQMTIRESIITPTIFGAAFIFGHMGQWWSMFCFVPMALTYYIFGAFTKTHVVEFSELAIGAIIAGSLLLVV